MSSQKTPQQRGWLEGTLDVISGMAHRPSTPTPQFRSQGVLSAPNSPMRGGGGGRDSGVGTGGMTIHRLPSQDSLDRSIHNDSGHGQKSTAQIIRDLKQSNARLTAKTAALEADFMNQLNETTRQYEVKQQKLEETVLRSEKLTTSLEHRCQVAETKLKEREESLQRVKEESAFQRHTISDLRTQLDWARNKDLEGEWKEEKQKLLRELALVEEEAKAEALEKEQLNEQIAALRRGDGGTSMAEALRQTQAALERVRDEGKKQQEEHEKQVSYWKEQLDKVQQTTPFEYTDKEEKEAESPSMSQQLQETKRALERARKELEQVKAQAEHQEEYRQEEADDLRLLNDAQEEEIERLRKDLEDSVRELELHDRELEVRKQDISDRREDENVMEESSVYLSKIQENLEESRQNFEKLEKEFMETKESKQCEIDELSERIEELLEENQNLQNVIQTSNQDLQEKFSKETMLAMRARALSLEQKNTALEKALEQLKAELAASKLKERRSDHQEEQERMESDYQAQLIAKETELAKLKEQVSSAMNKAEGDNVRVSELNDEVKKLRSELAKAKFEKKSKSYTQQSGGEIEEDLRKEVSSLRQTRKELRSKVETLEDELESSCAALRSKLADRDTTISALVKSNVSLESEVSSARIELQLYRARISRSGDPHGDEGVDVILARSEELVELRDSLAAYKETESRMTQEVSRLEKELAELRRDNTKLRRQQSGEVLSFDDGASASGGSVSPAQIKERDEAIARLVKQTVNQDKEMQALRSQIDRLSQELESHTRRNPQSSPTEAEMEQLRQESEMFAGQVIELDEEIESLRLSLEERDVSIEKLKKEQEELRNAKPVEPPKVEKDKDDKIAELMTEINDLKSRPMADGNELDKIRTLEAEVDELREAHGEQMNEIRQLRRVSRNATSAADDVARANADTAEAQAKVDELRKIVDSLSVESERLKKELEDARQAGAGSSLAEESLRILRQQVQEKDEEIEELKSSHNRRDPTAPMDESSNVDEFEVESMRDELMRLRRNMESQSQDLENAKQTVRELERMVAEKNEDAMAQWDEEKEELMADMEDLTHKLNEAQEALSNLREEKELIDDFKQKLELADEEREKSEKSIIDTFERKLSLLTLDKDVTIDKLRKELVTAKEGSSADAEELLSEIEAYKVKLEEIKEQATAEIQQRDTRIFALENTLEASKQLVGNMRTEMDHLQGSMVNAAAGRKEEIEDMQQELVDLTATTARQEREMSALRMKLEEKHLAHEAEVTKLQENITKLEGEKAAFEGHRNAHDLQMDLRVREVKERLEKLKWRNQSLQEENESLRQRLAKLESLSKADFVEREKYEKLHSQYSESKKQLKKLEADLEEARAVVVTPPPTISPTAGEKKSKSGSRRMGFLGRKQSKLDVSF